MGSEKEKKKGYSWTCSRQKERGDPYGRPSLIESYHNESIITLFSAHADDRDEIPFGVFADFLKFLVA